ncbi:MAG: hypothetical protein JWM09_557 [Francisellaceae bacterium]|nr:hypothetical protein [Francisellaceae bacterium]
MRKIIIVWILLFSFTVQARELAGVFIKETVKLSDNQSILKVQGAAIRTKFVFNIYVGAFYAVNKINSVKEALNDKGPKRMLFYILHDKIDKQTYQDAWREGIEANNSENILMTNNNKIDQFINYFDQDLNKGDTLMIDFIPKLGTKVFVNNKLKGLIPGDEFYNIVLNTWMGKKPPSSTFQKEILSLE